MQHEHKKWKFLIMETAARININGSADVPIVVGTTGQGNVNNGSSGGSVSTNSTITTHSSRANVIVPTEDLKIAMMNIYNDGVHVDPDAHEGYKVRKLVRSYLFNGLKFCTGEGRPSNTLKQISERIAVGKCHDRPDLTRNSYANHLMSKCGVDDKPSLESIGRRTRWWKTYGPQVQKEIRAKRSQINLKLRKHVVQGERSWKFCLRTIGYFNLTL